MGISRQGYYRGLCALQGSEIAGAIVVELVQKKRQHHPKMGMRKLYELNYEELRELGIGRDKFNKILRENNLLVTRKRRRAKTTDSRHGFRRYENKLKELEVTEINKAVVTDITYIQAGGKFMYLSLVTELKTRMIVGYDLSESLAIEGAYRAIRKGLRHMGGDLKGMLHHSDQGIQYCSKKYVNYLKRRGIEMSMSERGNPYENAIAERVNGILKTEYNLGMNFSSRKEAMKAVEEAIELYNYGRPHMSIGMKIPGKYYEEERKKLNEKIAR